MALPVETLSVADIADALGRARQAIYLWSPDEGDRIDWAGSAEMVLKIPAFANVATGAALRALFRGGETEARDAWVGSPRRRSAFQGELRLGSPESALWIHERLMLLDDGRYLGVLENVTGARVEREKLSWLARFDELTGLLGRTHLRTLLARRLAGLEEGGKLCFGLIGLDNMSGVNSAFGYDVADTVLVTIGELIGKHLDEGDALGRIGSSKFAIVFGSCPMDGLAVRLDAIKAAVRDKVIETAAGPVAVTVSAVGVVLPDHAATTHDAFAAAEDTLTHAKEGGLDQVVIHRPEEGAAERRRGNIAVADELLAALREHRLRLAYQPVVRADKPTQPAFHECLLRLVDRSGDLVAAGSFMPVAERLGLVRMLDKRVMALVFATLVQHPRVRLSMNVSPQSMRDSSWMAQFERLAAENPTAPERLIVEVTEATAIEDAAGMVRGLNRMRDLGCAIALDDFGAGYTSFQQLRDLQLDIVKIDGSYVRGIVEKPDNRLFVQALATLARHYDLMVVGEMVDDDEGAAILRELGVDAFQGFHFGKPNVEPDWLGEDGASRIAQVVAAAG